MIQHPVPPRVQAFVVCKEMLESRRNGELYLIGPRSDINLPTFPSAVLLSAYAHLTDARGRYDIGLQMTDGNGNVVWEMTDTFAVEHADPLTPHRIAFHDFVCIFPAPGRYDLVMVANGSPLAHHALWARPALKPEDMGCMDHL